MQVFVDKSQLALRSEYVDFLKLLGVDRNCIQASWNYAGLATLGKTKQELEAILAPALASKASEVRWDP